MEEQNIVYIITAGFYSDYRICAATLNKETAEKLLKVYSKYDNAQIEEYNLRGESEDLRFMYRVRFYLSGIMRCHLMEDGDWIECIVDDNLCLSVYVKAKDEDHAIKIAKDRRAEYLARKEGIV